MTDEQKEDDEVDPGNKQTDAVEHGEDKNLPDPGNHVTRGGLTRFTESVDDS